MRPRALSMTSKSQPVESTGEPEHSHRRTASAGIVGRRGTILSEYSTPARSAAELRSLLGDTRARVRTGAMVTESNAARASTLKKCRSMPDLTAVPPLALEQAKVGGPRVEVDTLLESETCVEGGYLYGHFEVRVRKAGDGEGVIMLGGAKIRIIGFESIPGLEDRQIFYQYHAALESISMDTHRLYSSPTLDIDGFGPAAVGVHRIPFRMKLPGHMGLQGAKGVFSTKTGVEVRYIAMASIKLKDSHSNSQSIAHFYRPVEIWPFFNPSIVLAIAPSPIERSAEGSMFMGGRGLLRLSAMLHRETWIAGQRCMVKVVLENDTKRTVKTVEFTLERILKIYRPQGDVRDSRSIRFDMDPEACSVQVTRKAVSSSLLEMGGKGSRGVVSARGWWTGCGPEETSEFTHWIVVPPDALTVHRGKLIEVNYELRVTANVGHLSSAVHVELPLKIINFVSIDPPVPLIEIAPTTNDSTQQNLTKQPVISASEVRALAAAQDEQKTTTSMPNTSTEFAFPKTNPNSPVRLRAPVVHFMQPPQQRVKSVSLQQPLTGTRPVMSPTRTTPTPAATNGPIIPVMQQRVRAAHQRSQSFVPQAAQVANENGQLVAPRSRSNSVPSPRPSLGNIEKADDPHYHVGAQMLRNSYSSALSSDDSVPTVAKQNQNHAPQPVQHKNAQVVSLRSVPRSTVNTVEARPQRAQVMSFHRPITVHAGMPVKNAAVGHTRSQSEGIQPKNAQPEWKTVLPSRRPVSTAPQASERIVLPGPPVGGFGRQPSPPEDDDSSTSDAYGEDEQKYHSDVVETESPPTSSATLYQAVSGGSISMPTMSGGEERARHGKPNGREMGAQWSSDEDGEGGDNRSPLNTMEMRASRAIRDRMSSIRFQAPLFRSSGGDVL